MQTDNNSFPKRSLLLLLSLSAVLTLTVSVFSQKQDGKPSAQSKQRKDGKGATQKSQGAQTNPSGKQQGGKSDPNDPCDLPQGDGEDEPSVAANSGSGMIKWSGPSINIPTARQTGGAIRHQVASCTGEVSVALTLGAMKKGTRYYQVIIPSGAGIKLSGTSAQNPVQVLDFTEDCEKKTIILKFLITKASSQSLTREFYIQWLKPVSDNSGNIAKTPVGSSVPASGFIKGKVHRVQIVCP